jgi:poly(3-hydroxybutyrate) depolymerase
MGGSATSVAFNVGTGMIQAQVWAGSLKGGPLILYWHGSGSSPSTEVPNALSVNLVTSAGGLIVAFNESTRMATTSGNSGDGVWYQSDLAFADQAVACAIAQYNIDTTRIHVAGYDAGALQAVYMWAARSAYVASVVSYSGGSTPNNGPAPLDASWENSTNVAPALVSHGAAGSDSVMGLDFANASIAFENMIKSAGGSWIDCNDGGNHTAFLGTRGPVLKSDAVYFFQAHPYGIKPVPSKVLPAGWPTYCAVDAAGTPPVSPGG